MRCGGAEGMIETFELEQRVNRIEENQILILKGLLNVDLPDELHQSIVDVIFQQEQKSKNDLERTLRLMKKDLEEVDVDQETRRLYGGWWGLRLRWKL
jgi:hypothetical protein